MGFAREARRVRDRSLPDGHRLQALGACVQMARPLGFHSTWSYLEARLGMRWRDAGFLLRAMDLIETERDAHLAVTTAYAGLRLRRKHAGLRRPRIDEVTPTSPPRWHGDEVVGAMHALSAWREIHRVGALAAHPFGRPVLEAVDQLVRSPSAVLDLPTLQRSLDWSRRQISGTDRAVGSTDAHVASVTEWLLGQICVIRCGLPELGARWNLTEDVGTAALMERSRRAQEVLAPAVGTWLASPVQGTAELVDAATDLLVDGFDTPTLRILAGVSPREPIEPGDPLVPAVLGELGLEHLAEVSPERAALDARLRRLVAGRASVREVTTWAHSVLGHDCDDDLTVFVELDDVYDEWQFDQRDRAFLERVVRHETWAYLAGVEPVGLSDLRWGGAEAPPVAPPPGRAARLTAWWRRIRS
ncbi:hypothetical protein PZ938_05370 [Luteipulveratus sp. YIM 133132]|uniref:hypothetical protein n=1 Tax=Luteipulveratus flavus TaxID=3031728 RepID=UPI0023AF5A0D|nr:hypothetical protein [Luteipulveratus sp. YIM 133132]MDE9365030.1 hypothetical protein [Luteipulveratus sp. YIM 133132]